MTLFFQHLQPAAAASRTDAARRLAGLVDLERNTGDQTSPQVLTDPVTGRKVLAMVTLPGAAADVAPYERDYPSSMVPFVGLTEAQISARTRRVLAEIEERGLFSVPMNTPPAQGRASLRDVPGYFAGVDTSAPFAVGHLGGNRWRVAGGVVRGGGLERNTQAVGGADLRMDQGWLGFWANLSPELDDEQLGYVYSIELGQMTADATYEHSGPYLVPTGQDDFYASFQAGKMFVPVAWVTSVDRVQVTAFFRGRDIVFPSRYPVPGVPIPTGGTATLP